ncbi:hypothetical protein [Streptomyces pseudovenezuelae]|uniref:Uncharacterized protein n=1 Tax=Streptomyces pseudovenezuelae TaxID=67350 RepID=A0ABT6M280_9ACTN|nr:hypothetical protein [Streptomyces pseudovenezuelae]MDH6222654.1 hypothetical protein [Streptomyces pseudovenezuelae]
MESEVIAALIGTPAVLGTAVAGWLAGRAQRAGTYHGAVDAARRTAQSQAYADLFRVTRPFIGIYESTEAALRGAPESGSGTRLPETFLSGVRDLGEVLDSIEHAADMVRLEGPDSLARIADRIWDNATRLAGKRLTSGSNSVPLLNIYWHAFPHEDRLLARDAADRAKQDFQAARSELLPAARKFLNGGPSQ